MNNIIIYINTKTSKASKKDYYLGTRGQNLQNKIVFEMSEKISGVAWLEYDINGTKNYALMEETETGYQIDIKSCLLTGNSINIDLRITETANPHGIPVFISTITTFYINNSIEATIEEPEQYPSWLEIANQKIAQIDNFNIVATKENAITTIVITDKDGFSETVQILDGEKGETGDKGEQGDPGQVKFIVVAELPTTNIDTNAIYLLPLTTPESQENNYAEYIYVNDTWELLGKIGVHVDLSNYYTKTESDNRYLQNSKILILTQAEYDLIETKDPTVYYLIKEV